MSGSEGDNRASTADIPEEWLVKINEVYRRAGVPPKQRPFRALLDYTKRKRTVIDFSSPVASKVFGWFKQRSAPEAHQIGALFTGTFFFDAYFWPVSIPVGWGRFKLNALGALETMPSALKEELEKDTAALWIYVLYWADCVDYAFGVNDIRNLGELPSRASRLLDNADKELRAAIAQLNSPRPNLKAILAARMATEIFLKVLLVAQRNVSRTELRKNFGHDIAKIADSVNQVCQVKELEIIKSLAHVFPPVDDRYEGPERNLQSVWEGMTLCQMTAATVIRQFSDRDTRSQVLAERGRAE